MRQGLLRAFEASPAYVGYWDADLATPLDTIMDFCELLNVRPDLEMVFGARVQLLGRVIGLCRKLPKTGKCGLASY